MTLDRKSLEILVEYFELLAEIDQRANSTV